MLLRAVTGITKITGLEAQTTENLTNREILKTSLMGAGDREKTINREVMEIISCLLYTSAFEIMEIIGKEETLRRVKIGIEKLSK